MSVGGNYVITFNSDGTSSQQTDPYKIVKEKLKHLLSTNKGEIPNDPEYGADLIYFTFNPIDDKLKLALTTVVRGEIGRYMPYVIVENLVIENVRYGFLAFELFYGLTDDFKDSVSIQIGA